MKKLLLFIIIILALSILLIFIESTMSYNLKINEEIKSKYSQGKTWDIIISAFEDSSKVPEWPTNEWIQSDNVSEGGRVNVQYKILGGKYEYQYQIKEISDFKIVYCPVGNHPLRGDISVKVQKDGDKSKLIWQGEYQSSSLIAKLGLEIFTKNFFKELREKISK